MTQFAELSLERIRALSDGIFAFALTVLVLDLHLPEFAGAVTNAAFWNALVAQRERVLSFLLSFVVLAMYWIAHHNTFLVVARSSRILIVLNFAFLLCVVTVPFAASFLGETRGIPAAIVAYGAILIVTSLSLAVLVWYALKYANLTDNPRSMAPLYRAAMARILAPVAIYVASIALAFASRTLSVAIYIALPLIYLIPSQVDHWASDREQ
jgi:uncharacterized membrane protein